MTRKPRELSSEEKRLWRRVAEGVKPRRPRATTEREEFEPEPVTKSPARAVASPAPAAMPKRPTAPPPADRGRERRVARGQVEIAARLDLHGFTQDGARSALERFLHAAHGNGARTVLVITGYGRGGEGVLKQSLPGWLAKPPLRAIVSGYAKAHRSHGGQGAAYVFLKRKPGAD
ncbi:MAG: Smr/MutS family protein [Hyphomonadaceae bacterium]|nr:Smr/MutS family protein [Hyphomonadaceae bacterium]